MALQKEKNQVSTSEALDSADIINSDELMIMSIEDNTPSYEPLPESIKQKLDAIPDVRMDRVESIKQQIECGSYTISSDVIEKAAEAMLNRQDLAFSVLDKLPE